MKKILFVVFSLFVFCFSFGIANASLGILAGTSPKVVSPAFEEEDVSLTPKLEWLSPWRAEGEPEEYVPDEETVVKYEWEIGTAPGTKNIDSGVTIHPQKSVSLEDRLAPGTTYYWRVRANRYKIIATHPEEQLELDAQSDWMPYGEFSTAGLTAPKITNPFNEDGHQISNSSIDDLFKWNSVSGAELYLWELWDGEKESGFTEETKIYPGDDFELLEYDTSYTLQVKACISCEEVKKTVTCELCSNWGTRSFSTKPPGDLAKAELISPDDDTVSPTPILKWEEVVGARYYRWQVKKVQDKVIVDYGWVTAPETQITISESLPDIDGGYEWTINTCPDKVENNDCSGLSDKMVFLVNADLGSDEGDNGDDNGDGIKEGDRLATCTYDEGECNSVREFCFELGDVSVCRDCSSGWKNCDDKAGCECELAAGKDCRSGECVVTGKACISGVDCTKSQWCDDNICKPCASGSANCDLSGWCDCNLSNNRCDGKSCVALKGGGGGIFGGGGGECPDGAIICNPLAYNSFEDLIKAITLFIFNVALVLAPIMFVISGLLFVTSAGNAERISTAKRIALYTAIGFAVILLASGLVNVLQDLLKGS